MTIKVLQVVTFIVLNSLIVYKMLCHTYKKTLSCIILPMYKFRCSIYNTIKICRTFKLKLI